MVEIWKNIDGYEGLYQISNKGRVKSICSHVRLQNGELMLKSPRILKPQNRNGYKCVNLFKNGQSRTTNVHRLVAKSFLDNPDNLPVVNHKDENRQNNNVENLEWCNHSYNLNYGTAKTRRVISQGKPVLQYEKNGTLLKRHLTIMEACRETGVNFRNISLCCNGRRKTAGGYNWKFEE